MPEVVGYGIATSSGTSDELRPVDDERLGDVGVAGYE
jgi:hypothetical protein